MLRFRTIKKGSKEIDPITFSSRILRQKYIPHGSDHLLVNLSRSKMNISKNLKELLNLTKILPGAICIQAETPFPWDRIKCSRPVPAFPMTFLKSPELGD